MMKDVRVNADKHMIKEFSLDNSMSLDEARVAANKINSSGRGRAEVREDTNTLEVLSLIIDSSD